MNYKVHNSSFNFSVRNEKHIHALALEDCVGKRAKVLLVRFEATASVSHADPVDVLASAGRLGLEILLNCLIDSLRRLMVDLYVIIFARVFVVLSKLIYHCFDLGVVGKTRLGHSNRGQSISGFHH